MLVGIVMQMSGFVSGQNVQDPQVSHTILHILSFGTIGVLAIGFIISLKFRLNLQTHQQLQQENQRMRKANGPLPASVSPQTRATVETLTGMQYESLWGNNNIGYLNRMKAAPLRAGAPRSAFIPSENDN